MNVDVRGQISDGIKRRQWKWPTNYCTCGFPPETKVLPDFV